MTDEQFKALCDEIARLVSIQEHIDQAELGALTRKYLKAVHLRAKSRRT